VKGETGKFAFGVGLAGAFARWSGFCQNWPLGAVPDSPVRSRASTGIWFQAPFCRRAARARRRVFLFLDEGHLFGDLSTEQFLGAGRDSHPLHDLTS
jgi:hypothetical protein